MTPDETALVLAKAALVDMRTIGEEDVMAWHEIVQRVDFHDALRAVARHYGETRDRLMPADLIRHARIIRDERQRLDAKHEVRELPGRYETDQERDARNKAGRAKVQRVIAPLLARMSLDRATPAWQRVDGGGAWWEDDAARERHARQLLAEQGRLVTTEDITEEGRTS